MATTKELFRILSTGSFHRIYTQFKKAAKDVGSSDKLKAGTYEFHKGDTASEVLDTLLSE